MTYQYHWAHLLTDADSTRTLNAMGHNGWKLVPGTWSRLASGYQSFMLEKELD